MGEKIVLVDDDPRVLKLVRDYLEQEGFCVLTASIGMDGINLIKNHAPKLVLLDWMLPDVSGLEICQYLRKSSSIPIIMITGRSGESERIMALEAGVDDYIVKPFNLRELVARIRTILRRFPKEAIRY